jgi:hypothetical protein
VDWPDDLPVPDLSKTNDPWNRINNVFFGAVGWIILHEIGHVYKDHQSLVPPTISIPQEYDADEFATRWVFENVTDDREREFRIMVVSIALAWLMLFEPIGGDAKHPPAHSRVREVTAYFGAAETSIALEVACHLFKILFFPACKGSQFDTAEGLLDWTLQKLREITT